MTNQIIIGSSFVLTLFILFLPGIRQCFNSIKQKPLLTILVFLLVVSVFLGSPRSVRTITNNPVDSVRAVRMLLVSLVVVLSFFLLLLKKSPLFPTSGSIKSFLIFSLLAMVSCFYSSYPLLSLWKGFEVFSFVVFATTIPRFLVVPDDICDIVNILWISLLVLVLTALIGIVFYPELARYKMITTGSMAFVFEGVFPSINANTLTQIAGLLSVLSLIKVFDCEFISHRLSFSLVFLLAVLVMLLAHSRTSILSFVISLLFVLFFLQKKKLFLFSIWLGSIAILSGPAVKFLMSYLYRGQSSKLFYSMSGRTSFWPLVWERIGEAPIFGHGFYTAHRMLWGGGSVDNTYLEIFLGLGMVGLSFFVTSVFYVSFDVYRSRPGKLKLDTSLWLQIFVIFLFLIIRSLTGPSFQILHYNLLCYVLMAVLIHTYKKMGELKSLV